MTSFGYMMRHPNPDTLHIGGNVSGPEAGQDTASHRADANKDLQQLADEVAALIVRTHAGFDGDEHRVVGGLDAGD